MVWSRLGDCSNVIEPFCGSAAFLLARPHPPKIETVNDYDCMIANFWRATKFDPEGVAEWADAPVDECQLHANHRWLVLGEDAAEFRRRMRTDPDFYDVKVAGRWCHGACCWIGSGWCSTPESAEWDQIPMISRPVSNGGVNQAVPTSKRPKLSGGSPDSGALGTGVHANGPTLSNTRPHLGGGNRADQGKGVHGAISSSHRPQLADAYGPGRGVHATGPGLSQQMPRMGARYGQADLPGVLNPSAGGTCAARRAWLLDWFGRLRDRLRTVRVCCGDWTRVCSSDSVTTRLGTTGIFFDAPYKKTLADGSVNRSGDLYANDRAQDVNKLVDDVIAYCVERGTNPLMRIVAASYEGEGYEVLLDHGWTVVEWAASGGYGNRNKDNANARRERLWVSPHCLDPEDISLPLFSRPEPS